MNKLLLLSAAIFASINLYGQGEVNFGNNASTYVSNSVTGNRIEKGNVFTAQLWYAPDGVITPLDAQMAPIGATTGISPLAGLITGGKRVIPGTAGPNKPDGTPGTGGGSAFFQFRVWETAYGATWEEANTKILNGRTAIVGASNIFKAATGDPGATPPGTPASLVFAGGLRGFSAAPVIPEPSIIGLGLLGAGALLFLRRRR